MSNISKNNVHIENILKKMEKKGYEGYLLSQFTNIFYISNYFPTSFAFCIIKENPIIFTSKMDMEIANKTSDIEIIEFKSFSIINDILKEEGISKIAIEPSLPISTFKKFEKDFNLGIENFISEERMIKSPDEISKITKATEIAQKSMKELDILSKYEKKATELELAYELGKIIRDNGAEKESFDTIITSGANSSLPHAVPLNKPLEKLILMDWGVKYEGYCSDNSRTIVSTEKEHEIFDIVLEAHNKAIKFIKPGIKSCEVDKFARGIISEYGYGDNFIHSTGHSLGLDIHESPNFSKKDETILEKNMVMTVEPGIYLENEFGVRIEDTIHIGNKGKIIGNLPYIIE
ncbi:aminopeptidase P family protein [Methanobrevibacter sp. OttesenSCG-928-K11]|nr:aminopeptidase P family protein [Methanobrevibacter sp. OttesenSCG-928-K11]MDL2271021.1 aminopeptidase P family protein [Methanobrevibacter sp. OttesenSCG-928-I08]